ncbi:MAG: site-specific tyrosine recombinase XerD [Pseudoclavibacter sp.]|nr:site-specific tyrosine recombinase XerD [Pseudoclavibacter sp.]
MAPEDGAGRLEPPALAQARDRYLRHLAVERGLSRNSLAAYRRDLARYLAYLGEAGVSEPARLRRAHVTGFLQALRDPDGPGRPLGPSSAARVLSAVRGWHRFLLDEGLCERDVAHDVASPKLPARLPKALSVDETARLLEAAGGEEPERLRDRALLELLYASGARVSEAVGLEVDDVAEREFVRVRGKGGKQRLVPLGSFAREALDAYLVRARPLLAGRGRGTPALFLGARGARLSRQSAGHALAAVAERAGLAGRVSPHTLRHSFATHLLQGGADVRVVQELLGHASVSTTQIYTLVTADALREMYRTAHPRAR